jgi:hypothetical protein
MTDSEMLALATEFTLIRHRSRPLMEISELRICQRHHDPIAWAIVDNGWVLNHDGHWEFEPMPSSRSEEFFRRTRWSSLQEAIAFAQTHIQRYPMGTKPIENDDDPSPPAPLDY